MRWCIVVFVAGCWSASPPARPIATPASPRKPVEDPNIRLISSGSGDKAALRYHYAVGETERFQFDMAMANTLTIEKPTGGANTNNNEMPLIRAIVRARVERVDPDGGATISYTWESCRIPPDVVVAAPVRASMNTFLANFVGLRATSHVSSRGIPRDTHFVVPAGATPAFKKTLDRMQQSMRDLNAPLPVSPVGIGAEWETSAPAHLLGADFETIYHYRLVARTDDVVRFEVTTRQHETDAQLRLDNGMAANLEQLDTKGIGSVSVALRRLSPTMQLSAHMQCAFTVGSASYTVHAKMTLDLAIAMRPAP